MGKLGFSIPRMIIQRAVVGEGRVDNGSFEIFSIRSSEKVDGD